MKILQFVAAPGLLASLVLSMATPSLRAITPAMVGCNLSGGEFGSNLPGVLGTDYFYPSDKHYDWCKSQGMALVRVPFRWERVQYQDASGTGTLNNFLNTPDISAIDHSLDLAESRGIRCILDMHNYAGRSLTINGTTANYKIGSTQLPTSTYANAWYLLAQHFVSRASLWGYDIMNEPVGLTNGVNDWVPMAQAAVNAIRQVDMVHPIIIEGYFYAQASSWATNGAPLLQITDPANNLIYSAHCYFDDDASGTWSHGGTVQAELVNTGKYSSVTAAYQVGIDRVTPFVSWCTTNNVRGLVGEFGSPMATDTADWDIILDNFLNYIKTNGNGLISTTQWGGGAWNPTYVIRMESRKDNSNPPPVAAIDSKYVLDSASNWWFPFTWYHNTIAVTADYSFGYSFASTSPAATCTFNTADTSTYYPGAGTTQSADLKYTIPAGGYAGAGMHIRGPLSAGAVGGVDISASQIANHVLSFYATTSTPGADLTVTLGTTADATGVDTGSDTGTGNWITLSSIAPLNSTWQHYEIPLSQIINSSIAGKPIERLRIGAAPADGNSYDVHIDQVTIQVASTEAAPTISVATQDGATSYLAGQNITLVASPAVANPDNSVDYVEFYANGQSLGVATASPYQWTTSFATAGTYAITAIVWDSHGVSTQSAPVNLTITGSRTLSLAETDIGAVSPAGSASLSNGTYTMNTGSGQQLMVAWTSDAFSFDYQPVSGDCSLTARVATLVCGDTAKGEGAVMIRESLATDSAFACIGVTTGRGVQFSYRSSTGATTVSVAGASVKAPYWVRLTRSGNTFTAYASADGTTWTQVGTPQTIAMASSVDFGLALCNHGGTGTATFDHVTSP